MGPAVAQLLMLAALARGTPPPDTATYADRATRELVARAMLRSCAATVGYLPAQPAAHGDHAIGGITSARGGIEPVLFINAGQRVRCDAVFGGVQ